jgi:hydroxymethylpyrimidine pyrophosphatase-like HAD family hydrolase
MLINADAKTIAVDFDGTIVEHAYPKIGDEMLFAFATLKELQKRGHRLILWTYREGDLLKEAVDFCESNGMKFYAVNESYPGERKHQTEYPRKLEADIFIDDRNVGGFWAGTKYGKYCTLKGGEFTHKTAKRAGTLQLQVARERAGIFDRLLGKR